MTLEPGKFYRAKTAFGTQVTFTVIDAGYEYWAKVDLEEAGAVEPNVWLNTSLLFWISSEPRRADAVQKAADEVIEALEVSAKRR